MCAQRHAHERPVRACVTCVCDEGCLSDAAPRQHAVNRSTLRGHAPARGHVMVWGERNTGTNLLEAILALNRLNRPSVTFGWKHGCVHHPGADRWRSIAPDTAADVGPLQLRGGKWNRSTLVVEGSWWPDPLRRYLLDGARFPAVGLVRAPWSWLDAMYDKPHNSKGRRDWSNTSRRPFARFALDHWASVQCPDRGGGVPIEWAPSLVALRNAKQRAFLQLAALAPSRFALLRYEDLVNAPDGQAASVARLVAALGLPRSGAFRPVRERVPPGLRLRLRGRSMPHMLGTLAPYSAGERRPQYATRCARTRCAICERIRWDVEEALGYGGERRACEGCASADRSAPCSRADSR